MKAFILAAGFGTRLLPHTKILPKPLFPVDKKPLIKKIIDDLIHCGFHEIYINTHHLNEKIENYISSLSFEVPVKVIFEKEILNTGGGILNILQFMDDKPFLVVNSDIYTDLDYKKIYDFHMDTGKKATLCLCKNRFNNVEVKNGFISGFKESFDKSLYTFTGVQVISPQVFSFFENKKSSIHAYNKMIDSGIEITPFYLDEKRDWDDLGTIESFTNKTMEVLIKKNSLVNPDNLIEEKIEGDGSDRKWKRIKDDKNSIIIVDHGIEAPLGSKEAASFIKIGLHLLSKKLPVPKIYDYDFFTGIALLQDLGDLRFQDYIEKKEERKKEEVLKNIIDELFNFSTLGINGFSHDMTYQTREYDSQLSYSECEYFRDEFLKNYLEMDFNEKKLNPSFKFISENVNRFAVKGLMHRDFQSRNIMVTEDKPYFIDFQGARKGPIQYDLGSFIIDPYMDLSQEIRSNLIEYASLKAKNYNINKKDFLTCFNFCALSRNLQILGAFSFLSLKKNKNYFKFYIPTAIESLKELIKNMDYQELDYLKELISNIKEV